MLKDARKVPLVPAPDGDCYQVKGIPKEQRGLTLKPPIGVITVVTEWIMWRMNEAGGAHT